MSKKEEQRKKKEELQAAARRREKRNALLLKSGMAVFAVLAIAVFYQGLFTGPPSLPPDLVGDADHVRGAEDPAVTVTVYADFQCPACFTEFQVITRAWPRISDKAQLVYRHFPLDTHPFAFQAARYAEAAARQGQFWAMHDLLFANQQAWSGVDDATLFFDGYAEQIGLDMAQLREDIELAQVRAKINADQQSGIRAGVRSTPSMFINGRQVATPRTAAELVNLVEAAASA